MAYEPEGAAENIGDALGILGGRFQNTLQDSNRFIEERGHETGGTARGRSRQPGTNTNAPPEATTKDRTCERV
jgi:hypothetical protein